MIIWQTCLVFCKSKNWVQKLFNADSKDLDNDSKSQVNN